MNRLLTPKEMVDSIIETGKKAGKEHGLSEAETTRMIYSLAGAIGQAPMEMGNTKAKP